MLRSSVLLSQGRFVLPVRPSLISIQDFMESRLSYGGHNVGKTDLHMQYAKKYIFSFVLTLYYIE